MVVDIRHVKLWELQSIIVQIQDVTISKEYIQIHQKDTITTTSQQRDHSVSRHTSPEITRYRCTRCKDPKDVETKPSLGGHKWQPGDIIKEPTCITNGEQQYTCTICNQTKTEPVKATGHDWQINKILSAATCTSNGIARYICKTCGYEENHTIYATGHKPEIRNKKEATCSSTGYTGDTYCSVCNKKLSLGETIAKKEHTWVKQDNIPATCEKAKWK